MSDDLAMAQTTPGASPAGKSTPRGVIPALMSAEVCRRPALRDAGLVWAAEQSDADRVCCLVARLPCPPARARPRLPRARALPRGGAGLFLWGLGASPARMSRRGTGIPLHRGGG